MVLDNLKYTGMVSLQITRNGKEIRKIFKNTGLDALFKLFTYALSGNSVDSMIPTKISIYEVSSDLDDQMTREGNAVTSLPVVRSFIPQVTYIIRDNTTTKNNIFRCKCNLPMFRITNKASESFYLVLQNSLENPNDRDLAQIQLDDSPFAGLNDSDQVAIIWDMFVENSEGEIK
jgi:hypothetical protein